MKKRFLAIFMSLCMMLGAVPLTAFAGEGGSEEAVCSCEEACTEENVNEDCGVCVGDYTQCFMKTKEEDTEPKIEPLMNDTVIYVSNDGGGDGESEESTLTFAEAIHKINMTSASGDEELKFVISLVDDIEYTTDDSSEGFDQHHTTILGNGHSITTRRIRVNNEGTTLVLGDQQNKDNELIVDAMVSVAYGAYLEIYSGVRFENLDDSGNGMQQAVILSRGSSCTMYGGVITGLHYEPQGVIQINDGSRFTMYDGEISNCIGGSPSDGYGLGGAIFMQDDYSGSSKLEIYGGTFKNNKAYYGGAIYVGKGTDAHIENALFEGNKAVWGGAVYAIRNTEVYIENSVFKGNEAIYGGAHASVNGITEIKDSQFEGNSSAYGGAMVFVGGAMETKAEISDCNIYKNKAIFDKRYSEPSGGDGGALYIQDAKATLSECTITKNMAENSAGGVYFTGNELSLMALNINGALQINDNEAPTANNTYLVNLMKSPDSLPEDLTEEYQTFLTVTDSLNKGDKKASIGIYMDKPGVFTADYDTYCGDTDPGTYFFSDDINYHVEWTEDKTEARLVEGKAKYLIQAEAGSHGAITPEGEVMVEMGEDITFTITPDSGYKISDVIVDGESIGAEESYTFKNVKEAHTIEAVFEKKSDGGSSSGGSSYSLSSEAYYVRYHDGDDLVKDGKYGEGERVTVKGDVFEAPLGKALAGWSTEEDGEVEYVPGDTFRMPDKSVNLYAVWEDETQIHNAYISGYPDGTVRPDKTITRAEAAVMFYNLLDEKSGYINTFTDVPENQWYSEAVITLAGMGVVNGYLDGTFRPDAPITRAEFVTMAVNFAKAGKGTYCSFADVSQDMWYYGAVAKASEKGWIGGYPDGTFGPERYITRAEVTVIINRMENREADMEFITENLKDMNAFTDLPSSHWAYSSMMEAANGHKYVRGEGYAREIWTETNK